MKILTKIVLSILLGAACNAYAMKQKTIDTVQGIDLLSSMPNEVIENIFFYTVNGDDEIKDSKELITRIKKLCQIRRVSRRFLVFLSDKEIATIFQQIFVDNKILHDAFKWALGKKDKICIEALALKVVDFKDVDKELYFSAIRGYPNYLRALIRAAGEIDQDKLGNVLVDAVKEGNVKCVEVLINSGANASVVDNDGLTVMQYAATGGNPDVLDTLVASSLDVNMVDRNGGSALHWAVIGDNPIFLTRLLELGADVRISSNYSGQFLEEYSIDPLPSGIEQTALHFANYLGNRERCVLILLAYYMVNGIEIPGDLKPISMTILNFLGVS